MCLTVVVGTVGELELLGQCRESLGTSQMELEETAVKAGQPFSASGDFGRFIPLMTKTNTRILESEGRSTMNC